MKLFELREYKTLIDTRKQTEQELLDEINEELKGCKIINIESEYYDDHQINGDFQKRMRTGFRVFYSK